MIALIVTLILASLLWIILDNLDRRKFPPGPLKLPIFGNALQISLADKLTGPAYFKLAKKYGDVMSLKAGTMDSSKIYECPTSTFHDRLSFSCLIVV